MCTYALFKHDDVQDVYLSLHSRFSLARMNVRAYAGLAGEKRRRLA